MMRSTSFAFTLTLLVVSLSAQSVSGLTRQAPYTKATPEWNQPVRPFRVIGNIYYVGSTTAPGYTLVNNPKYPNIASDYEYTFRLLRSLPCDVFLGPHGSFFNLKGKAERLARGEKPNPFIDGKSYRNFLDRTEKEFVDLLSKQKTGSSKKAPE